MSSIEFRLSEQTRHAMLATANGYKCKLIVCHEREYERGERGLQSNLIDFFINIS